jgi:outer membrane autotransporter protein
MSVFSRLACASLPVLASAALAINPEAARAESLILDSDDMFSTIEDAIRNGDFSSITGLEGVSLLGVFQGTANFTASGCQNPADNGPESGSITVISLSITDVEGTFNFGFGVLPDSLDADGVAVFDLSGLDPAGGSFSGSVTIFDDDDEFSTGSGSASGSVSGDTLSLSFSASEGSPSFCNFTGSALLRRVDGAAAFTQNAPSTTVVVSQNLVNNTRAVAGAVASRIQVALGKGGRGGASRAGNALRYDLGPGLNAGDDLSYDLPFGVWAAYTRSDFSDDFAATAFRGDRNLAIGGFDFSPFENALLGLSIGWEGAATDTRFNQGRVDSDGILVSPYFAYTWSDTWQIDALFGYTSTQFDQFRTTLGGVRIDSSTHSQRFFWGGNFTGFEQIGNWYVAGRFGLLWMREAIDGYTESNGNNINEQVVELAQWRLGADTNYSFDNGFQPFASVTYERDFAREPIAAVAVPGDDDDGFVMNAGIRYFHESGFTGSFEWNGILGRSAYEENSYTVYLRKQF